MNKTPLRVELALLGFLRERPVHPYELYQVMEQANVLGHIWHLKQSHLYALLRRLEEVGYISTTMEARGSRPPRKVMHLTTTGRDAFDRWLTEPVAHGRDFRLEFLAKLFFAMQGDGTAAMRLLDRQRQVSKGWLDDLDRSVTGTGSDRPFEMAVVLFRRGQVSSIVDWLDQCAALFTPRTGDS